MKEICVIGGANIDICGISDKPLVDYDSNPGKISLSFGGVGRNIAEICTLLKGNVRFVTCFADDDFGRMIREDCIALGMDCHDAVMIRGLPTSMYLAIMDDAGDMRMAMSDMRLLAKMDMSHLTRVVQLLDHDDMIIVDANLEEEALHCITQNARCPIAVDPVSTAKAVKFIDLLDQITIFKPNRFEAEAMNGIAIKDEISGAESVRWFMEHGVKEVLISLAEHGVLFGRNGRISRFHHRHIHVENATGGGDALIGAYVKMRTDGYEPDEAIRFALSAAATEIALDKMERRTLNSEAIKANMNDLNIEESIL